MEEEDGFRQRLRAQLLPCRHRAFLHAHPLYSFRVRTRVSQGDAPPSMPGVAPAVPVTWAGTGAAAGYQVFICLYLHSVTALTARTVPASAAKFASHLPHKGQGQLASSLCPPAHHIVSRRASPFAAPRLSPTPMPHAESGTDAALRE